MTKWSEKNRFSVALETENPPHNHWTIDVPTIGIAEARLVITVAPQKDIWPHGKTYPKNAVAIVISKITIPENQVSFFRYDENMIPREIWMYIKIKKNDAPFICIFRLIHPELTARMICIVDSKAISVLAV